MRRRPARGAVSGFVQNPVQPCKPGPTRGWRSQLLDETGLQAGALSDVGVASLRSLGSVVADQKLEYDFQYHQMAINTDYQVGPDGQPGPARRGGGGGGGEALLTRRAARHRHSS